MLVVLINCCNLGIGISENSWQLFVMVVLVLQHLERIVLPCTLIVVSCKICKTHFHHHQSSFDLQLVAAV